MMWRQGADGPAGGMGWGLRWGASGRAGALFLAAGPRHEGPTPFTHPPACKQGRCNLCNLRR